MECNEFRCMGERCNYSHCTIHESNKVRSGLFSDSHNPIYNEQEKDIGIESFWILHMRLNSLIELSS